MGTPISAYLSNGKSESDLQDVATWRQQDFPRNQETIVNGITTISQSACSYFTVTLLAHKADTVKQDYTPIDLIDESRANGYFDTYWGHFDFTKVDKTSIKLKLISSSKNYIQRESGTEEQKLAKVKELMDKGYYVMANFDNGLDGAHYVGFDYYDEERKDFRIMDSFFETTWYSEYYGKNNLPLIYILAFESEKKSTETHSIYKDESGLAYNKMVDEKLKQKEKVLQTRESIKDMMILENKTIIQHIEEQQIR